MTTANGEVMDYSLADYELKLDRKSYQLEVAVVKVLPIPVLLGNDVLLIEHTLKRVDPNRIKQLQKEQSEDMLTMITWSSAKCQQDNKQEQMREEQNPKLYMCKTRKSGQIETYRRGGRSIPIPTI